jgi:hypothetical protein
MKQPSSNITYWSNIYMIRVVSYRSPNPNRNPNPKRNPKPNPNPNAKAPPHKFAMVSPIQHHHNQRLIATPAKQWQAFYTRNGNRFFKDRHWLFQEPMFADALDHKPERNTQWNLLETGCGVGNAFFPIGEECKNRNAHLYACDFAKEAVKLVLVMTETILYIRDI